MTDEDVFFQNNWEKINKYIYNCKAKIPFEERQEAIWLAFLYAIRTYRKSLGEFKSYLKFCIDSFVNDFRRKYNRIYKERFYIFSLNRRLNSETTDEFIDTISYDDDIDWDI